MINARAVGNTAFKHTMLQTSTYATVVTGRARYSQKFLTGIERKMRPEHQNPGGKFLCSPGILQTPTLPSFFHDPKRYVEIRKAIRGSK